MRQLEICFAQTIVCIFEAVRNRNPKCNGLFFCELQMSKVQLSMCTFVGVCNFKRPKTKHSTCCCSRRYMDNIRTRSFVQFSVYWFLKQEEVQSWCHSQVLKSTKYGLYILKKMFFCPKSRFKTSKFH